MIQTAAKTFWEIRKMELKYVPTIAYSLRKG